MMSSKTTRLLAVLATVLLFFLLATDVSARGRGGGRRGGGGFSRGGGGFSRGGGGLNRRGAGNPHRSPNISRNGPAKRGSFGRDEGRRDGWGTGTDRRARRPASEERPRPDRRAQPQPKQQATTQSQDRAERIEKRREDLDPEQKKKIEDRVDQRREYRENYYDNRDDFYEAWRNYRVGTSITVVTFNSLSCTPTTVLIDGTTYYDCGGVWYNRVYRGGSVTYLVVDAPSGH